MPALKAVRDDFSAAAPHFYWTLDLKLAISRRSSRRTATTSAR
jgi:hypothetical protein